ncbi:dTDP-4-dehydrorhamnose reductase [Atopomonas sediminilitoris]|uniref:dTDP-4-dehydrorhamnose reductase n=1 Tax=Atopomonas sediminilitoris TaxID=2919919 RepID=UPI001F4EA46B|nr:dTDP-4-dehydrorhamnose reductase [Atopomonas sediminilitoris]
MKILLTGINGQVGAAIAQALADSTLQHTLIALDRQALDLSDAAAIARSVQQHQPDIIINPAAYTAVDQAEHERELAFAINAQAPKVLAEQARLLGIPLLHFSTDYVFDGSKNGAWLEHDPTGPLNVYGASKLEGERAIQDSGCQHLILRTSWVYSRRGKNFYLTMRRLLSERDRVSVVADQHGTPTPAGWLAAVTLQLLQQWQQGQWHNGIYHCTPSGVTSWFGFAQAIAAQLVCEGQLQAALSPIPSSAYPTPAARPANSQLDCGALARDWQISLPSWEQALSEHL